MLKVRFHLQRGRHYMHWQIKDSNNFSFYVNPDEYSLVLQGCILVNKPKTAQKIFDGASKTVCSWIECVNVEIVDDVTIEVDYSKWLRYSPRENIYWFTAESDNEDGNTYKEIVTLGRGLIVTKD